MVQAVLVKSPRRGSKSTRPSLTQSSRRTFAASFSSADLPHLARETKRKIKWDRILRGSSNAASQWKWLENSRNFSLYTKQGNDSTGGYGVLSIGVVKGSVPEISSLLVSNSQAEYERKMAAIHDKDFKNGSFLSTVANDEPEAEDDEQTHLSIRTATFAKSNWLHRDDEWCFMEATKYEQEKQRFEKLITTLSAEDVLAGDQKKRVFGRAKTFHDVVCGYRVQGEETQNSSPSEEAAPAATSSGTSRVHFYAELASGASHRSSRFSIVPSSKREASSRAIKQRLLRVAKNCDRLSNLVRRRRLGIQVLVDERRLLPPTNTRCFNCDKLQIVAKLCCVCGQGVCGDCSDKYERQTHSLRGKGRSNKGDVRIQTVRVCAPCLARVEGANYDHMSDAALSGPEVFPDDIDKRSSSIIGGSSAAVDLKMLLHDALLQAPSHERKGAVMSVIRCVLDQERELTPPATPSSLMDDTTRSITGSVVLSPMGSDADYINALDYLDVKNVPYTEAEMSDADGRSYPVNPKTELGAPMPFPLTEDEEQRMSEINKLGIIGSGTSDELNIICDIAAKEMDAFATIVTIITDNEQHVVAANVPALEQMRMKREDSFCQHTIMGTKPLIVPHPESDVRFSRIMPITGMGIKYYCGFPLVAGDGNTVIGTLCCVDQKSHDITESQYTAMQKLAQTAAKVVRIQGDKRRNSAASPPVSSVVAAAPVEATA